MGLFWYLHNYNKVYCHGEDLPVHISINNHSKKAVKNIRVNINQHCELTMINAQYSCKVIFSGIAAGVVVLESTVVLYKYTNTQIYKYTNNNTNPLGGQTGVDGRVSYTTRLNHEPDFCIETFSSGI